jgi:hypothetical protein
MAVFSNLNIALQIVDISLKIRSAIFIAKSYHGIDFLRWYHNMSAKKIVYNSILK